MSIFLILLINFILILLSNTKSISLYNFISKDDPLITSTQCLFEIKNSYCYNNDPIKNCNTDIVISVDASSDALIPILFQKEIALIRDNLTSNWNDFSKVALTWYNEIPFVKNQIGDIKNKNQFNQLLNNIQLSDGSKLSSLLNALNNTIILTPGNSLSTFVFISMTSADEINEAKKYANDLKAKGALNFIILGNIVNKNDLEPLNPSNIFYWTFADHCINQLQDFFVKSLNCDNNCIDTSTQIPVTSSSMASSMSSVGKISSTGAYSSSANTKFVSALTTSLPIHSGSISTKISSTEIPLSTKTASVSTGFTSTLSGLSSTNSESISTKISSTEIPLSTKTASVSTGFTSTLSGSSSTNSESISTKISSTEIPLSTKTASVFTGFTSTLSGSSSTNSESISTKISSTEIPLSTKTTSVSTAFTSTSSGLSSTNSESISTKISSTEIPLSKKTASVSTGFTSTSSGLPSTNSESISTKISSTEIPLSTKTASVSTGFTSTLSGLPSTNSESISTKISSTEIPLSTKTAFVSTGFTSTLSGLPSTNSESISTKISSTEIPLSTKTASVSTGFTSTSSGLPSTNSGSISTKISSTEIPLSTKTASVSTAFTSTSSGLSSTNSESISTKISSTEIPLSTNAAHITTEFSSTSKKSFSSNTKNVPTGSLSTKNFLSSTFSGQLTTFTPSSILSSSESTLSIYSTPSLLSSIKSTTNTITSTLSPIKLKCNNDIFFVIDQRSGVTEDLFKKQILKIKKISNGWDISSNYASIDINSVYENLIFMTYPNQPKTELTLATNLTQWYCLLAYLEKNSNDFIKHCEKNSNLIDFPYYSSNQRMDEFITKFTNILLNELKSSKNIQNSMELSLIMFSNMENQAEIDNCIKQLKDIKTNGIIINPVFIKLPESFNGVYNNVNNYDFSDPELEEKITNSICS
ncbi:von Willebrand factor, type A domain-containing protein [Strongyloides ratti]|uniref:von Willebrand factor, type A domain-containing protein n=1 Tax=Strongyloides ratti TaxID=34506 RepID=A0A090LS49_STRRB|nr:von Willebrand factor, type A domain-containing protein [Strongyloides ratti]CEF70423.1 von Willebrand factor, type A domain-containing protein [Strongyloides ratti]